MVRRAAVLIGVGNIEGFPRLESASSNVRKIAQILEPSFDDAAGYGELFKGEQYDLRILTEDLSSNGKVTSGDVLDAIEAFVTLPATYHELVVFFSGHGLWVSRDDIWLLSDGIRRTSEAINLKGSMDLAFYSGIPNISFISDACRSLPSNRSMSMTTGINAFPNYTEIDDESVIDSFKAAIPGTEAYEIPDLNSDTADGRISVMTCALREAFESPSPEMVKKLDSAGETITVVTNRSLQRHLPLLAQDVLAEFDINKEVKIVPVVPSSDNHYLARVQDLGDEQIIDSPYSVDPIDSSLHGPVLRSDPPPGDGKFSDGLLDGLLGSRLDLGPPRSKVGFDEDPYFREAKKQLVHDSTMAANSKEQNFFSLFTEQDTKLFRQEKPGLVNVGEISSPGGINSAFNLSTDRPLFGRAFFSVRSPQDTDTNPGPYIDDYYVEDNETASSLDAFFITLGSGKGIFLPHLATYRSILIADDSDYGARVAMWRVGQSKFISRDNLGLFELFKLTQHDKVGNQVQNGKLTIQNKKQAKRFADAIRQGKFIDPTLGVYACYAYQQAGFFDQVVSVNSYLRMDGVSLFDVEMMAHRTLPDPAILQQPCPLLTQGWHLLSSRGIELSPVLKEASAGLCDSLWTMFDEQATNLIVDAIKSGEDLSPKLATGQPQ